MKKLTIIASLLFCFALGASAQKTHKHKHHKKHHHMSKKEEKKEDKNG